MSHADHVTDPISAALQRRCADVREASAAKQQLEELLAREPALDAHLLVGLLAATWERLPEDLTSVGWASPSSSTEDGALEEALAIGLKVAGVLEVYSSMEEGSHERQHATPA